MNRGICFISSGFHFILKADQHAAPVVVLVVLTVVPAHLVAGVGLPVLAMLKQPHQQGKLLLVV